MLCLLGPDGLDLLPVTSQNLLAEAYPEPVEGRTYPQLSRRCRHLLMEGWRDRTPDLARYLYPPSLKPHPFMPLNKLDAGRLHRMRSGKGYLHAHPSWDNDSPTTCSRCNESLETFKHAILSCPTWAPARDHHLQAGSDMGPDAPVWSSATLLGALSRFIRSTRTAFTLGMFSRATSAATSASSCSSYVVSFGYFMSSQET